MLSSHVVKTLEIVPFKAYSIQNLLITDEGSIRRYHFEKGIMIIIKNWIITEILELWLAYGIWAIIPCKYENCTRLLQIQNKLKIGCNYK